MQNRNWMIHGTWAIAATAAFALGNLRQNSSTSNENTDPSNSPTRPRTSTSLTDTSPTSRDRTRPDRNPSSSPKSLITDLFGSKTSAAGLDALALQALRDPNPITRRLAFSKLLEAMTPENAEQIRAQLVDLGADREQWRDFHYSWGAIAGPAAFAAATETEERDLAETFTGWAAAKPAEAIEMLKNLPPDLEDQRAELTRSVVSGLADSNRALATELVLSLNSQGNNDAPGLMEIVANETLRADGPQAASQWSETLPNGPLKAAAMGRIADDFARRDPLAAAAWAQTHASQDYATRAIERISGQWTAQDPQAAVGWLESLPPGSGQTAGLQTAFSDWEDRDPVSAGQYLLSMPTSPQRDNAISGFSNGYAWQNPQVAIQWANDISDPALRTQTLTRTGQIYFRQNPEAARTWLESSNLPPETQQQILNPPRR